MSSDEPLLGDIQSAPVKRKATTWFLILAVIGLTAALIVVAVHKSSSGSGEDTTVYSLGYNTTQRILSFLNESADPCEDFYEYACGNFHHVIPEGEGTYSYSFSSIGDLVHAQQLQILTSNFPMISDFYSGCMDTDTIETRNVTDLLPWFARIDAVTDVPTLLGVVGALQRAGFASSAFVNTAIQADLQYADVYRLYMTPSGLTLGGPKAYHGNVTLQGQMFELLFGVYNYTISDPVQANLLALQGSINVWNIETAIANITHPLSDQGAQVNATTYTYPLFLSILVGMDWSKYLTELKASPNPQNDQLAVMQIEFFSALTSILKSTDLSALKDYVKYHTILGVTQYLPEYIREVGQELSDQYDVPAYVNPAARMAKRRALDEIPAATQRQRYCQAETVNQFENYLSHEWLLADLPAGTLPAVSNLVDIIYDQIGQRLKTVDWLKNDNATRDAAVWKWQNIVKNVGPTSSWYRYSHLLMTGLPLIDRETVQAYYLDQTAKMYGQKVNRSQSSPNTDWTNQNAFYDPSTNSINLLPGLMFPPFYSPNVPTFLNLATYGMVIGHEITHGFDNDGRHYNGSGAYVDWWTAETAAEFDRRATCLVNQYDAYPVLNTHVHGNQTLGENIADNGGIRAAWNAYQKQPTADINKPAMAQLNNDKLFFVYFAQSWCTNRTTESQLHQLDKDVHSPAKWRVNGPLSNLPYFANTYGCRADQPMGRSLDDKKRCEVW